VAEADTTNHTSHDPLLVAALVDRELSGAELDRARTLVAACTDCAELRADLASLAVATRELPTPARSRSFILSPADVERLRPNLVRRLLGAIGTSRDAFSRPLAMGLTTLGLAGLLVATVPSVLPTGGPTLMSVGESVEAPEDARARDSYTLSAAPEAGADPDSEAASMPPEPASIPGSGDALGQGQGEEQHRDIAAEDDGDGGTFSLAPDPTGMSTLIVVSGSLLIVGLGLFALRWTSRRFGG
jgi:hypothetical protein